jgi:hypothetical protein
MADILAAIQGAGAPETQAVDIGAALDSVGRPAEVSVPPPAPTRTERAQQGFGDTFYGLGRIAQHVAPDAALNLLRRGASAAAGAVGATDIAASLSPVSTAQFDSMVTKREQGYQQAREAAGQTGIDWWRLGGSAANPVNYIGGGTGAAPSVLGRVGQAVAQGAGMGAAQSAAESTTPDGMWWDTAKGAITGAAVGGAVGGATEAVSALWNPLVNSLRSGVNKARKLFGADVQSASMPAADAVVNKAMHDAGANPATIDLNLLRGMRQDVQSALEHGADISPQSIVSRAKAESLPVPVQLTRGQATGDAMQFAREQNLRGVTGVGEPLTNRLTEQNQAFIGNLDALGAKNAPSTVDTGNNYAPLVKDFWDTLQAKKDGLYAAVRNSQGQSAAMDGVAAAQNIKAALDSPQASHVYDALPANIKKTIESLNYGEFPLTVAQAQSLDKLWYQASKGADGSTSFAINEARRMLADAPIVDSLGADAQKAYQLAKQAHAQQMSLIEPKLPNGMPNPNFQPIVKAVVKDGIAPEKLFGTAFLNAPPSAASKNLEFLTHNIDPDAPRQVGQTLMGEIKRQALNDASAERGTVSQSVLTKWANNPVQSARLDALMPKPAADTFRNLASTVETAKRFPVASAVNTSNTGSAVVNAASSVIKNSALAQFVGRLPLVRSAVEGLGAAKNQTDIATALYPGVTLKSLMTATPLRAAGNRLAAGAVIPAATAAIPQAGQRPQD